MTQQASHRCIALFGGSFDPVHNAHVALAAHFVALIRPDELRLIPAGNPWQKKGLQVSGDDRIAMLERAFAAQTIPVVIDRQEIDRNDASYTIDTLCAIRAQTGPDASLVFLMGADQLQQLHTWHRWEQLFDLAHLCAAARPGFATNAGHVSEHVLHAFAARAGAPDKIRTTPHGLACLSTDLNVDISSTDIRAALQRGERPDRLVPAGVLDYIEQHHLYRN